MSSPDEIIHILSEKLPYDICEKIVYYYIKLGSPSSKIITLLHKSIISLVS